MLHILFAGEGETDVGLHRADDSGKSECVRLEWGPQGIRRIPSEGRCGAVPVFVIRILAEQRSSRSMEIEVFAVPARRVHRRGFQGKVQQAMADAEASGRDAVVFVIDRDGPENKERLQALRKGREEGRRAGLTVPTAVGVAVEMIEAWLLADEQALGKVLGIKLGGGLPAPETIEDPKRKLNEFDKKRVLDDAVRRAEAIAERASLEVVRRRCPQGFAVFCEDVVANLCRAPGIVNEIGGRQPGQGRNSMQTDG